MDGKVAISMDKVAIITAAGRGIGAAVAQRLSKDGWRVAVMSPSGNAEKLAATLPDALGVTGSLTEAVDIERLVAATLAKSTTR